MSVPISLATASWGTYWSKFGEEFLAAIQSMDPLPAEVVLVTDAIVTSHQSWLRVLQPVSNVPMWDWFNEAVAACRTEWIICVGVDDLWLPNGLFDLNLDGHAVQFAGLENGRLWEPKEHDYNQLHLIDNNPMAGGTVFRREVFLRHPWRRSVAADHLQWIELQNQGIVVRFDNRPRFNHRRHADAHSIAPLAESDLHVRQLKWWLRNGVVEPGAEWPPLGILPPLSKVRETWEANRRNRALKRNSLLQSKD